MKIGRAQSHNLYNGTVFSISQCVESNAKYSTQFSNVVTHLFPDC